MDSIAMIKYRLIDLEAEKNWNEIACFLHQEWERQKENGELTTLLIQQMVTYIIDIDDGCIADLHVHQNDSQRNRDLFSNYLQEAVEYGLLYCLDNKYFLWQMCLYCSCISTYYPLYGIVQDPEKAYKELLLIAHKKYPHSILFACMEEHIKGNWQCSRFLSDSDKTLLQNEIARFDLKKNMADQIAEGNLNCHFD